MQPRSNSREFAIILFCLLGIAALNDFSHNKYRGFSNPIPTILKAIKGSEVLKDYQQMTIYDLLDKFAADPRSVEGMKGIAIKGQILQETATENPTDKVKVGKTFRLSRRFSQSGTAEGAHVISVKVNFPKDAGLEPNMWVLVQGQVKLDPNNDSDRPMPMIDAVSVTEQDAPDNPILTPQGEQTTPQAEGNEGGEEY